MSEREVCRHKPPKDALMYRCRCGNVWLEGQLVASVDKDQTAASVLGILRPPVEVEHV